MTDVGGSRRVRRGRRGVAVALLAGLTIAGTALGHSRAQAASPAVAVLKANPATPDMNKIKHIVMLVQENRSFDEYFGMYPGVDGIPTDAQGNPNVCIPNPGAGTCDLPFHDPADVNHGGPHGLDASHNDVNNGAMDGFIAQYEHACANQHGTACQGEGSSATPNGVNSTLMQGRTFAATGGGDGAGDVMGYKLRADIPNYWAYADNYVLADHFFEPLGSWSEPAHLALVSGWSALCYTAGDPMSCRNEPDNVVLAPYGGNADFAWTSIATLLDKAKVPWAYYVYKGTEPDCDNPDAMDCIPAPQSAKTPSIWNPMAGFDDVRSDGKVKNIQSIENLMTAAKTGNLPAVSWVIPTHSTSEHPPAAVSAGEDYVTYIVNKLMQSPDWDSTAIFVSWDDWGGFYDHLNPPTIDENGYGIRAPSILISPYAKQGYVDHQTLSTDAYLRLIEDRFLGGARLDPATDGRPDNRPDVRENAPQMGNLLDEFDFSQPPRPGVILPTVSSGSKLATPMPNPPAASAIPKVGPSPVVGFAPFAINFDGSASNDPNGIKTWTLRFGDGAVTHGKGTPPAAIPHTYTTPGFYKAKLTIKDKLGNVGNTTQALTVMPPRSQRATWLTATPIVGYAPQPVVLNGSDSAPGNWSISFGDGSQSIAGTGTPPSNQLHTYNTPGNYTQTLTVTADGVTTTAQSRITVVEPAAPIARTKTPIVIKKTTANLDGHIVPNASNTTAWFSWGTSPNQLTNITPAQSVTRGSDIEGPITGLQAGTTYYFMVTATNSVATIDGRVISFTTPSS